MMIMKKIHKGLSIALGAMFLAGSVGMMSACGPDEGNKDLYVLLLVNNQEDAFYKKYFAGVAEELGVNIKYEGMSYNDYDIKLATAMQDRAPDIFYVRPGDIKNQPAAGAKAQRQYGVSVCFRTSFVLHNSSPYGKGLSSLKLG